MGLMRVLGLAGCVAIMAGVSLAEAPKSSIRPKMRPAVAEVAAPIADASVTIAVSSLRPRPRPANLRASAPLETVVQAAAQAPAIEPVAKKGLFGFLRPNRRPNDLVQPKLASAGGIRVLPGKQAVVSKKGSVCGIADIKGETLAPIPGKLKGCGIENPVRVTSVAGVQLSTPATINCETAKALKSWINKGVEPIYGKGQVVELQVFASYACRGRNNKKNAKVSEHGRGNAIDIGGLTLANGKTVTVLHNFDRPMKQAHKAACGIFGTTLGPGSDGYHENHMHFDVARYRGKPYCR